MGKIILLAILAIAVGFAVPTTRPMLLEKVSPVLYPLHSWQTMGEMEEIAREIGSFERTYYKLPVQRASFTRWLERNFVEETAFDTWGTGYVLDVWPDSFAVKSAGPDKEIGTEDDLRHLTLRLTARAERSQGR